MENPDEGVPARPTTIRDSASPGGYFSGVPGKDARGRSLKGDPLAGVGRSLSGVGSYDAFAALDLMAVEVDRG